MPDGLLHKDLSYRLIGFGMYVHRELEHGFLEKVYEIALMITFRKNGIRAEQQIPIRVMPEGCVVGEYCADYSG